MFFNFSELILWWVDRVPNMLCVPGSSIGKESACSAGDPGFIPGSGRSLGEGNGNPLQYSCWENSMNRGAWWAIVCRVAKSWTRLKRLGTYTQEDSEGQGSLACCSPWVSKSWAQLSNWTTTIRSKGKD